MWHRVRPLAITLLFAGGTAAALLAVAWPRTTHAEEIPDFERVGEYDGEGMKFGNIVVRGQLVPAASVPGGWTLVRELENQSDAPEKCVLEERVLRTETMPGARVEPAPTAMVLRNQPIALGPHEKRRIGVALPKAVGEQITAGLARKAWIEQARGRALAAERYDAPVLEATYMAFHVEYLTPLPPGATAQRPVDNGITRPAAMPMVVPMAPPMPTAKARDELAAW